MKRCHGPFSDRKDLIVIHGAVDDAHQKHQQEQSTHVNLPSCIQIGCASAKCARIMTILDLSAELKCRRAADAVRPTDALRRTLVPCGGSYRVGGARDWKGARRGATIKAARMAECSARRTINESGRICGVSGAAEMLRK